MKPTALRRPGLDTRSGSKQNLGNGIRNRNGEVKVVVLSERLEIRLDAQTMLRLREEARRRGVSMGRLLREAIDKLLREDHLDRLRAAEELCQVDAPAPDWEVMKQEIEAARIMGEAR